MDLSTIVSTEHASIFGLLQKSYERSNAASALFYFKLESAVESNP